jgi:hypothetical protein
MSDNTTLNPGVGGDVVAADDVGGVKYQVVKLDLGSDGVSSPVSGALPVSGTFYQATQPVSAASLPLPTGAATQTTLAALETLLTTLNGTIGTSNVPYVPGSDGQLILARRRDTDSSPAADGDLTVLNLDEEGRLKVASKPASYAAITGNVTSATSTVPANTERFSNLMIHCTGTFAGANCTFEGSLNSTNGTDGNWFVVQAIRTNANTIETTTGVLGAAPAYAWELSVNALKWFRIRATAWTSGTQVWTMIPGTYATEPIPGAQTSATQPVSGTVTVTSTRITPNAADGHSSTYHLISAASTNDTLVLTGARAIGLIAATNINAAARFLKVYNKATAPTSADTPIMTILLKPGETTFVEANSPIRCALGIGIRLTTGIAVADTGAVAAADHSVAIMYT